MLEGIKIIEMATYIAAPSAGGIMADWGADVIKIEPLGGCPMRKFYASAMTDDYPDNPVSALDNRGKRAIAVNTGTEEGREIVRKLVEDADVFLTNVRPGQLKQQGLDFDTLSKINPKLVYASVTGFGLEGDEAKRIDRLQSFVHRIEGAGVDELVDALLRVQPEVMVAVGADPEVVLDGPAEEDPAALRTANPEPFRHLLLARRVAAGNVRPGPSRHLCHACLAVARTRL